MYFYRSGFGGVIRFEVAGWHMEPVHYTTAPDRPRHFKYHEEAIGYAKGVLDTLILTGTIVDPTLVEAPADKRPALTLLEGGKQEDRSS